MHESCGATRGLHIRGQVATIDGKTRLAGRPIFPASILTFVRYPHNNDWYLRPYCLPGRLLTETTCAGTGLAKTPLDIPRTGIFPVTKHELCAVKAGCFRTLPVQPQGKLFAESDDFVQVVGV